MKKTLFTGSFLAAICLVATSCITGKPPAQAVSQGRDMRGHFGWDSVRKYPGQPKLSIDGGENREHDSDHGEPITTPFSS